MTSIRKIAAVVFLVCVSSVSWAAPIIVGDIIKIGNNTGSAFTPTPILGDSNGLYSTVTFRLDNSRNQRVSAGLFVLDQQSQSNGWDEFYSFCLQPNVWLMPFSNPYSAVALQTSGYNTALAELWGRNRASVLDDISAAAFQVAVWELAYDGDRSLATGDFQLLTTGAVYSLASNWLAAIDGAGPIATNLITLQNNPNGPDRQDLLTTAVPEPASFGLILASLLGLGLRRRK